MFKFLLINVFSFKDTPNTLFDDFTPDVFNTNNIAPDLSVLCKLCKIHIKLDELKEHNEYHEALNTMGYKELPLDSEELNEKRKTILKTSLNKHMKKPKDFYTTSKTLEWSLKVKNINDAFELIKSYLNNTFESNRQLKNLSNLEAQGIYIQRIY